MTMATPSLLSKPSPGRGPGGESHSVYLRFPSPSPDTCGDCAIEKGRYISSIKDSRQPREQRREETNPRSMESLPPKTTLPPPL